MGSPSVSEAVVVCAEVLGRFGVSAETVSRAGDSPEAAIEAALDRAPSRAEFLRRTISTAPRGIDAPARYARETPWRALRTTFEALGWSFAAEDRSGRPVADVATPAGPFSVTVEDETGRSRTATVEYPSTPLGRYNLPAVLAQVECDLLYGLDWEFVALSDGADRWRFAPIRTEGLETLRAAHGARITPFDRPVLARDGPERYDPPADPSVWPAWTDDDATVPGVDGDGPDGTHATSDSQTAEPGASSSVNPGDVIRFVGDDGPDGGDGDTTVAGVTFDSLSGWSFATDEDATAGGGSIGSTTTLGSDGTVSNETDGFTLSGSPTTVRAGTAADDAAGEESDAARSNDGESDDDFFDGGLSGGPSVDRVENESFGLPESQTEDERLQAAGAAIDAGGGVSVSGLLDDESFLPTIPAEGPTEVTLSFEDSFDPSAPSPAETRESEAEDGFVWVNADGLE